MLNVIACPSCKTEIEVSEIMAAQLSATLRAEMEAELTKERRALGDRARQIEEQDRLLQDERGKFELQIQTRLANEQQRLLTEARAEAARELSVEMTARDEKLQSLQKLQNHIMHLDCSHRRKTIIESLIVLQHGNQMGKVDAIHGQLNASSILRYHLDALLF